MTTSTALSLPERAAVALGTAQHEIQLRELVQASCRIVAVTNAAGREEAHRAAMSLRNARTSITSTGKAAREDATAFSKAVIAEEKRLVAIIEPEEERVFVLRDGFDAEEKARKDAKIAAERARVDAIQRDIQAIRDVASTAAGRNSVLINAAIEIMEEIDATEARFAEFAPDAAKAIVDATDRLTLMHAAAIESERAALAAEQSRIAEAARQQAEREELAAAQAKLKADQAAQVAEQAALLAEWEKNAAIERAAIAAEQRIAQAALDADKAESARAAAVLKAAQDEFNAKIAAHEAKLAGEARAAQKVIDDAAHAELMAESLRLDRASRELAEAQRLEAASVPVPEVATTKEPEKLTATWSISLDTTCPHCNADVDLIDCDDFWDGKHFTAPEYGTDRTKDVEVNCPECMMDFKVDLDY